MILKNKCIKKKNYYYLALQDNDTKVRDRVMYIDNKDSLYMNITG